MANESVQSSGADDEVSSMATELHASRPGDPLEEFATAAVPDSPDSVEDNISRGTACLPLYAETRDEGDLLATYQIAGSLPVQAFSPATAHAPVLENFLKSLHSSLCLHAENDAHPAFEYAADVSRLSLVRRPAENDVRTGFLDARAVEIEKLIFESEYKSTRNAPQQLLDAIKLRRRLLELAVCDDEMLKQRVCLASLLWMYWEKHDESTSDLVVLREGIELRREILQAHSECDLARGTACDQALLDEALKLSRAALRLHPEGHPERARSCRNLATSLRSRFNQTGDTALLNEALVLDREALLLYPEGHSNRALSCKNLANSLRNCFEQTGDMIFLDEALELDREVLRLHPEGHPKRALACGSLAISLWTRFDQTGEMVLLDEAITLEREALLLRPEGHPDRGRACINLASSLRTRYNQTGDTVLLDETIRLERKALRLRPTGHPSRARSCAGLASSLFIRFHRTETWRY